MVEAKAAWLGCVLLALATIGSRAGEERFTSLARDSTGKIWAIPAGGTTLAFLDSTGQWIRSSAPSGLADVRAVKLQTLADGAVACLWSAYQAEGKNAVTLHRGSQSELWASFAAPAPSSPGLLGCANGTLVVTGQGNTVVSLRKGEQIASVLKLPDALFIRPATSGADEHSRSYASVRALEDTKHRIWLWSYALDAGSAWRLKGLVQLEGNTFRVQEIDGLVADARFSAVTVVGARSWLLPVVGKGLYRLDPRSFSTAEVTPPDGDSFHYIENIFSAGRDWYVLSCPPPTTYDSVDPGGPRVAGRVQISMSLHYDPSQSTGVLWRKVSKGWERVISGVDYTPRFGWIERPVLEKNGVLLIGSNGRGPLRVDPDSRHPVIPFNWTQNFPLRDAVAIFPFGTGSYVILASDGSTASSSLRPVFSDFPAGSSAPFRALSRLLCDQSGEVWGFGPGGAFGRWKDGEIVEESRPGAPAGFVYTFEFVEDDKNHGWLMAPNRGPLAVCDFSTGTWQTYQSLREALVAQLPGGVSLSVPANPFFEPVYSTDHRIAYFDLFGGLSYFDGTGWRSWTVPQIGESDSTVSGSPFFDRENRLCMPLDGKIYQWSGKNGWQNFERPAEVPPTTVPWDGAIDLPLDFPVSHPLSVARDRFGVFWFTSGEDTLFKAVAGKCVPMFRVNQPNPLRYQPKFNTVIVDRWGNAFLGKEGFSLGGRDYVFIKSAVPLPDTKVEYVSVNGDQAEISVGMEGKAGGDIVYSWRIDGGPWSAASADTRVHLDSLSGGQHVFEARAFNAELSPDQTPARTSFFVAISDATRLEALVAVLGHGDTEEREKAAAQLRSFGPAALPALRRLRESAPPDSVWWIDAVIQSIEEAKDRK
ncbi:MAG: hypothetical protein PHC88_06070 [Terrimicrobiaceae bacterium]|nr:hypothetical protein [Terrimicrobiaceae bacterium]